MMRSVPVSILFAFVVWAHGETLVSNHTSHTQESLHELSHRLVDLIQSLRENVDGKSVNNLLYRALKLSPPHNKDVNGITLGKPRHLASQPGTSLRAGMRNQVPRRVSGGCSGIRAPGKWQLPFRKFLQHGCNIPAALPENVRSAAKVKTKTKWELGSRKPGTIWPNKREELHRWISEDSPTFKDYLVNETREKGFLWPILSLGTTSLDSRSSKSPFPELNAGLTQGEALEDPSPSPSTPPPSRSPPQTTKEKTPQEKSQEYRANVGQAIDQLRDDHKLIPTTAPGLGVALETVRMELAQFPQLSFKGKKQYTRFWGFFRTAVSIVSADSRSEVLSIYQVGSSIRVRWRLLFTARVIPPFAATVLATATAAAALIAASEAGDVAELDDAAATVASAGAVAAVFLPLSLKDSAGGVSQERQVDFNSIYQLDCWNGRIEAHTLEFRTPQDNVDLVKALQWSLSTEPLRPTTGIN